MKILHPRSLPAFHLIFDINMDGMFTRKSIFVANSHINDLISSNIYSSVVAIEIVRIAFLPASLNDLGTFSCDI